MPVRKKLLFLVRQLGQGGTERRLTDLSEALSDEFDIAVHSITGTDLLNDKFDDYLKELGKEWSVPKRVTKLYQEIARFSPDLVHSFDLSSGIYYKLISMGMPFRNPVFLSGTGSGMINEGLLLKMIRIPFLQPDLYVCNSHTGADFLKTCIPQNQAVKVIANGLNKDRYSCAAKQDEAIPDWAMSGRPVVGYIGKLDNTKHGERILEVANLLKDHPLSPAFVVFGDGPNRDIFEAEVKKAPQDLQGRIHYFGTVHNAARFIRHFTVGTLFSDSEGFPNVILEYMSMGVPWVSTNAGDVQHILDKGPCGYVLPMWDRESFAKKIKFLLENRDLCTQFGATGNATFLANYTIEISLANYRTLYEGLLSDKN